jgi:hypothetical protein
MKLHLFIWFFAAGVLFLACSRNNEEMFLPQAVVTMYTPKTNAIVRSGDTIYLDGLATSATNLHGYELTIKKPGGPNLYFQHFHEHNDTLFIKDTWKNNLTGPANLELLISVILDHEDHRKNLSIPLQVGN